MEGIRRFDDRVANYERFRPGYPDAVAGALAEHGVHAPAVVADIGAGTGKLSQAFLRAGHRVILIEPNAAMRTVAQRSFADEPRADVRDARAEATGLADASMDAIVAGQAFHWFEPQATRAEWLRILRPRNAVALVWNDRRTFGSPVLQDYEALLLRHCPDYAAVQCKMPDESAVLGFLGAGACVSRFDNAQVLDWEGLLGRVLSASYVPLTGPVHEVIVAELRASFARNAVDGHVTLPYDTRVFHGTLR